MDIEVKSKNHIYNVHIEKGALSKASNYLNLERKVLIVTDTNIPVEYVETLQKQCKESEIFVFKAGEKSKNFVTYQDILVTLLKLNFSRKDCIVALGGGVAGDMAGFAASTYMRGIDFYNIPTSLLAMVDSSIGGKTAIDLLDVKNIVGTFYPPMGVLIDTELLKTLPKREFNSGLAEAIKMSLGEKELFEYFENVSKDNLDIENIIHHSLLFKKKVVEEDEKEKGLRQILNFGHTIGHAIETNEKGNLLHGECVAIGMVKVSKGEVKDRIIKVLEKFDLPTAYEKDKKELSIIARNDKKADSDYLNLVLVKEIGKFEIEHISFEKLEELL